MQLNSVGIGYSVSAISTSPKKFFDSLVSIASDGVQRVHVDVMDGRFVPRFGLYPEFVEEIRQLSDIPIDVHMMIEEPERYISDFVRAGASRIVPHIEPVNHVHRLIQSILNAGVEAGIALNPHSDTASLRYIASDLSAVTMMAINPGIVGHKILPFAPGKVQDLRSFIDDNGYPCLLEIDGGVTFDNISDLAKAGADQVVVGAGTIFKPQATVAENLTELNSIRRELQAAVHEPG